MVAANGIYKLAVIGTAVSQQHIHTLHFRSTLAGNAVAMSETAFMQDLLDAWKGAPATAYRSMFNVATPCVQSFQVRKVCGTLPLPAGLDANQPGGSQNGTGAGGAFVGGSDFAASWLASVTTERSALSGRRYRGRYFIGGLLEGHIVQDAIQGERATNEQAYATALTAAFITPLETAVNYKLFVYSRTAALIPGTECQNAGADVVSLVPRLKLATMKSRKAGSGL
jgi:hypothetical protein